MAEASVFDEVDLAAQADVAAAQKELPPLDDAGLDLMFRRARSHNKWSDRAVSDETLANLYELTRFGPTAGNGCPARFVFVRTKDGKDRLRPALSPNNVAKGDAAPVVVIVGHDMRFFDQMGRLFPHVDTSGWFEEGQEKTETSAFRNGSLQGAYMMLAARALGLDCGPMSGFDNAKVDAEFFAGTKFRSNFICALGHADPTGVFKRLPRLEFDEVCTLV
ncbi:MAG: malonic semialdehyde reductase [Rhodospirillaceae bacterium]|nr:malonic semialdehyde reductase [Rhodospirillaceae bacterium]